jgi:cation:H+ antiporter
MVYVTFAAGVVLLLLGAESLVKGASRIAAVLRIPPLIVGLTVVAFGTSAPEFAVGLTGALSGSADVTVGNVVGSNILNVLLILGIGACVAPFAVALRVVRMEVPFMVGATLLAVVMALDGTISLLDGAILFGGLLVFTAVSVRKASRERTPAAETDAESDGKGRLALAVVSVLAGLGLLTLGAHWLVESAVLVAQAYGVDELIVSLVVVALGTSLPEIATTVVAAKRGEGDLAVGGVVGSNLFNLLGVLGLSALVSGSGLLVQEITVRVDLLVMAGSALICLPVFITGHRVSRFEGGLLISGYVGYTGYLILRGLEHPALQSYLGIVLSYGLPALVLTLVVSLQRDLGANQ